MFLFDVIPDMLSLHSARRNISAKLACVCIMLPLNQADYSQGVWKGLNKTTREHPDKLRCAPQQAPTDSCERGALEPLSSGELSLMLLYYSITLDQMQKGSQQIWYSRADWIDFHAFLYSLLGASFLCRMCTSCPKNRKTNEKLRE